MKNIEPSATLQVGLKAAALVAEGRDIILLTIGEPDFDTPEHIKEAGIAAIRQGKTKYTSPNGLLELRKAIQIKFKRENDLDYNINQIVVGCGAKQILYNLFMATLNEGDEVIIPAPFWASYPELVSVFDGKLVTTETKAEAGFKIDLNDLERVITDRTKWLLLNFPGNPTGAVYTEPQLKDLAKVLEKYPHVHILSDEIYEHIIFDGKKFYTLPQVAPQLKDRTFIVNGLSKAYAMTGWRVGYGAGSEQLIDAIASLNSQSTTQTASISQFAAVEALNGSQELILEQARNFELKRNIACDLLSQVPGIKFFRPEGAFYLFPSIEGWIGKTTPRGQLLKDDFDVTAYLLDDAGVAVTPGTPFCGKNHIRMSIATSVERIKESMSRIKLAGAQLK